MKKDDWKLATQYPPREFCSFCGELIELKAPRYHNEEGEVMCESCAKDN